MMVGSGRFEDPIRLRKSWLYTAASVGTPEPNAARFFAGASRKDKGVSYVVFAEHYCCNDFYLTCEHAKLIIILIGDWPIPVAGLPDIRSQYNYSVICSARSSILAHYFLISFSRGRVTARPGSLAFPGRRAPGLQPGQHRPSQGFFAAGSEDSPLDEEGW